MSKKQTISIEKALRLEESIAIFSEPSSRIFNEESEQVILDANGNKHKLSDELISSCKAAIEYKLKIVTILAKLSEESLKTK